MGVVKAQWKLCGWGVGTVEEVVVVGNRSELRKEWSLELRKEWVRGDVFVMSQESGAAKRGWARMSQIRAEGSRAVRP